MNKFLDDIGAVFAGAFGILLIIALFLVAPFLFIWSINTLLEQGGSTYHITHGFWSYLASYVMLALVRGGCTTKTKEE